MRMGSHAKSTSAILGLSGMAVSGQERIGVISAFGAPLRPALRPKSSGTLPFQRTSRKNGSMRYHLALISLVLPLSACDSFYGVESRASLRGPVDVSCVGAALYGMSEAGHVSYQRDQSRSTELWPKQRKVQTIMHVWLYGEGQNDILQINQTLDSWEYRNSRSRMGVPVPHEEMVRFVPLMQKVNRTIQEHCGLPVGSLRGEAVGETKPQEI